jgi:kinesin family protein 15
MIAAVSEASTAFVETLSTLKFAQRAKLIKNKASVNEESSGNV